MGQQRVCSLYDSGHVWTLVCLCEKHCTSPPRPLNPQTLVTTVHLMDLVQLYSNFCLILSPSRTALLWLGLQQECRAPTTYPTPSSRSLWEGLQSPIWKPLQYTEDFTLTMATIYSSDLYKITVDDHRQVKDKL